MKSLPQWSAPLLLATPLGAWALGLGDIELKSALNQPLRAEIELLSVTPEELDGLRVALASRETFERFNLDRPAWLSDLRFDVRPAGAGRYVVTVTSRQPVTDPFLTMLVEATWPRGRLLREYTVLLDPPIFSPDIGAEPPIRQAEAGSSASSAGGAVARQPEPRTASTPSAGAPSVARTPTEDRLVGDRYGPVESAETLWSIATRLRPSGVTVNQMMVALYEANPSAFDGNMNLLLRGATLVVPSRDALLARSAAEATAMVRSHEDAWRGGAEAAGTAVAAASTSQPGSQQGRLRLIPPSTESVSGAGSATSAAGDGGASADEVARLESEVARLTAELEQSRRLLELRNAELEALQARLADGGAVPEPAEEAARPAVAAGVDLESEQIFVDEEPVDSPVDSPVEEATVDEEQAAIDESIENAATDEPAAVETAPVEAPAAAPVAAPPRPTEEPSLLSRILGVLSSPFVLIGVGIGAVLLTAVWYLRNRREDIEDVTGRWEALEAELNDESGDTTSDLKALDEGASVAGPVAATAAAAAGKAATAAAREEPAAPNIDDSISSQTVINLDQGDVLAEADFHMAYGLYDQAAELVQKALENEPHRRDLRVKLLEVYFVWGNKEAFREAAQAFKDEIGATPDSDWDKVLIMGKQICPGDPLFAESASAADEVDVALDADGMRLDFAFDDKTSASSVLPELDFDLAATGQRETMDFEDDAESSSDRSSDDGALSEEDMLAIGARTAAGIEAALFADSDDGEEADTRETATASGFDDDDLAELTDETDVAIGDSSPTQETPTIESETTGFGDDWAKALGLDDGEETGTPTALVDADADGSSDDAFAPTIETPTVETASAWADSDSPTMESPWLYGDGSDAVDSDSPTMESPWVQAQSPWPSDSEAPTVETPALGSESGSTELLRAPSGETTAIPSLEQTDMHSSPSEYTEEIDLEDLGLTVEDLSGLPDDLGTLPDADLGLGDTREQPKLDDDLLAASGITEVAEDEAIEDIGTAVLGDRDATMLAPIDDEFGRGTAVLERDGGLSGNTALLNALEGDATETAPTDTGLDLDLDDLSAAFAGGDTVEQPRSTVESELFEDGGATPVEFDVGYETIGSDDPTGTEDLGALDPHTMTEIGTKLDLARAYIDMGDPDGARSILEEVLQEGDAGQRREAQGLIDALSS